MIFEQIFNVINVGLVVLDHDLRVKHWNRWMELHSGIPADQIVDTSLFAHYPELENQKFQRHCKAVLNFGNFSFFSQKLHKYLFPLKASSSFGKSFAMMQQSCTMGPIRDEQSNISHLFIAVQDVTELVAYESKLIEMNMQDGLTGVYNRRFFEVKIGEEFSRHKRYGRPFVLIMCDLDYFKRVNDTYGHQCGDQVLKVVAATIQKALRETDILVRYGGEEFCCLLPETDLGEAQILAERLRRTIEEKAISYEEHEVTITVSLGISVISDDVDTPEKLVAMADEALYRAKGTGRNQVVIAA